MPPVTRNYSQAELKERKHYLLEAHRLLQWLDDERWYKGHKFQRARQAIRDEIFDLEQQHHDPI